MRVAIILVHYRTPALLLESLAALDADARSAGLDVERIVVDNSRGADQRRIADLDATVVRPDRNLGYAGGVNLGVSRTDAEVMVLMNPDVLVLRGCLPRLLDQIRSGAAAVGPRLWWDRGREMLLPPGERRGLVDEILRALAPRSPYWQLRARRRWRAHARRHWTASKPISSYYLSGGILAVARATWERIGGFDEGYRLYFEETDWLLRLRRAGLESVHEPRAEAVHLYARSSAGEQRAEAWFAASEARFRERHRSPWARRLIANLAGRVDQTGDRTAGQPVAAGQPLVVSCVSADGARAEWIELSPDACGFPAAGARSPGHARSWSVPREIRRRLPPGAHTLRAIGPRGRELSTRIFRIGAGEVDG